MWSLKKTFFLQKYSLVRGDPVWWITTHFTWFFLWNLPLQNVQRYYKKTACSCYSYSWYKSCVMLLRKNTKVFVGWFCCIKNTNAKDPTARYCYKSYASNANFGRNLGWNCLAKTCAPVICFVFLPPFVGRFRVFYSLSLQRKVYRVGLGQGALEINVLSFADLK